jgi:hypothetical protein
MTVAQAIHEIRSTMSWPKVDARDGLTHRMYRYDRRGRVWRYACDQAFLEDAERTPVATGPITCVACMGMEGRTQFVPPP